VLLHPEAKAALGDVAADRYGQMPDCTVQTFVFRSRKGVKSTISKVQAWRILTRP